MSDARTDRRWDLAIVLAIIGAIFAGAFSAGLVSWVWVMPRFAQLEQLWRNYSATVTTTTHPAVEFVPLERQTPLQQYPDALANRHLSPALTIYQLTSATGTTDDQRLPLTAAVADAVSLTADGWLGTTYSAIKGRHANALAVAWQGNGYPVTRMIRDAATDIVFIKIETRDLPAAAFLNVADASPGMSVWLEPMPQRFYPQTLVDLRSAPQKTAASSEVASRRFLITAPTNGLLPGAAVWTNAGVLVGWVESPAAGGWSVIPAADASRALSQVLDAGQIRHASLGIRGLDLATTVFRPGQRVGLPPQGVWLHATPGDIAPVISVPSAAAAVLRSGDVIERIERDILDGTADIGERLLDYQPGSSIQLYGQRQGQPLQVSITLSATTTSETLK